MIIKMPTIRYVSDVSPERNAINWMGIDQSLTAFAVAVLDEKDRYAIYVISPTVKGASRLKFLQATLMSLVQYWSPESIAMEGTVVRSSSASVLGELSGVIKVGLFDAGYLPLVVPPMTLKKFVIGTATQRQKSHMMMAALKRYQVEIPDDNAVDAYGLSRIARGVPISKIEEQVLAKLADSKFRE